MLGMACGIATIMMSRTPSLLANTGGSDSTSARERLGAPATANMLTAPMSASFTPLIVRGFNISPPNKIVPPAQELFHAMHRLDLQQKLASVAHGHHTEGKLELNSILEFLEALKYEIFCALPPS
jgi:hypothetical protein